MSGTLGLAGAVGQANASQGGLTLQLDSVLFDEATLEVPGEIGNLGGDQVIAQHDYPGGTRTQQTYGAFPSEIFWHGRLTGPNALDRASEIDRIRVAAQPVSLFYGPKQWTGRVVTFDVRPRHQWLVEYAIRFLPLRDLTAPDPSSDTTASEAQLGDQMDTLDSLSNDDPFPMPATMVTPVDSLQTTTQVSLSSANGIVDNISAADAASISAAVVVVQASGAIVMTTGSAADAYMAAAAMNAATLIAALTGNHSSSIRSIAVVNPNLPALAAQYLGSAALWQNIAAVNGIVPPDPMPLGQFSLLIPSPGTTPILS